MLNTELFIGAVYVAGLLSFFSPCIFPLLPVYIGMLSTSGKKSIIKTVVFVIVSCTQNLGHKIGGAVFCE